jgi:DNA-binding SARP family transcriptional activator
LHERCGAAERRCALVHLALSFLGLPRITRDGETVVVDRSKAVALLGYLALTGQQHTRDALAALLWP